MLITLTTDFGAGSHYVGQVKAVLHAMAPQATVIDLAHNLPQHDCMAAALVLESVTHLCAAPAVHLCVVDPGVGTARAIVAVQVGDHYFVAPDNGVLTLALEALGHDTPPAVQVTNRSIMRSPVSATFHGRDIMAPATAFLARGGRLSELGPPHDRCQRLIFPSPRVAGRTATGQIIYTDRFGNLITNIARQLIEPAREFRTVQLVDQGRTTPAAWVRTYGDGPTAELLALWGSSDRLELAVRESSAAEFCLPGPGAEVQVAW